MKISYKTKSLIYESMGIALVGENGGVMGVRCRWKHNPCEIYMNGEHMVAGSEENKRQDFTVNSIQGQELTTAKFKCRTWFLGNSEVVGGWQKRVLESRMGQKCISDGLWVLQDITHMITLNVWHNSLT